MRVLWLVLAGVLEASCTIIFKKIILNANPSFGSSVAAIETLPSGLTVINIEMNLTKTVNGKVQLTTSLFTIKGKGRKLALQLPTLNYCDLMRGHLLPVEVIQGVIDQLAKFGRLILPCPFLPGHYFLKGLNVDETKIALYRFIPEKITVVLKVLMKQEIANKMVRLFDLEAHYICNRSNWPK